MTRHEFVSCMAYLAAGIGKSVSAETAEVYWSLLGDLPPAALQTATQRVLLEHRWSTFPSVAELREAAAETLRGIVSDLTAAEAWALVWKTAGRIDPESEGSIERQIAKLPPLVREAMQTFGIPSLCYGREPVGVIRGQFMKVFDQLAAREKRLATLPDSIKRDVKAIGERQPAIAGTIGSIGRIE